MEREGRIRRASVSICRGSCEKTGIEEKISIGFVFTFAVKILCGQVVLSSLKAKALQGLAVGLNRHYFGS
ncbi:hypothetical protein V6N13_000139 [Hibiscus sabdariffa]|uniref:Uncharacterized protein n=2 Tax=Hibiscus sabdariffa TaxID=183260 RepID=A0ABR2ASG2_9ROSI